MENIEEFYPSEVARLVLGYLNDINCLFAWEIFLVECTDLQEHYKHYSQGKRHTTNVNGKSLQDILIEYCRLKQKVTINEKSSSNDSFREVCRRNYVKSIKHRHFQKHAGSSLVDKNNENKSVVPDVSPCATPPFDDFSHLQSPSQDNLTDNLQKTSTEIRSEDVASVPSILSHNCDKIRDSDGVERAHNGTVNTSPCGSNLRTSSRKRPASALRCHTQKSQKIHHLKEIQTDIPSSSDKNIQTKLELMLTNFPQRMTAAVSTEVKGRGISNSVCNGTADTENLIFKKQLRTAYFHIGRNNHASSPSKKRKKFIPKRLITKEIPYSKVPKTFQRQRNSFQKEHISNKIISQESPLVKNICDIINKFVSEYSLHSIDCIFQSDIFDKIIQSVTDQIENNRIIDELVPLRYCEKNFVMGNLKQKSTKSHSDDCSNSSVKSGTYSDNNGLDLPLIECPVMCTERTSIETNTYTINEGFQGNELPLEKSNEENAFDFVSNNGLTSNIDCPDETSTSTEMSNITCMGDFERYNLKSDGYSDLDKANDASWNIPFYQQSEDVVCSKENIDLEENYVPMTNIEFEEKNISPIENIELMETNQNKEHVELVKCKAGTENSENIENETTVDAVEPVQNLACATMHYVESIHSAEPIGNILPVSRISPINNFAYVDSFSPNENLVGGNNFDGDKLKQVSIGGPFKSEMIANVNQGLQASNALSDSIFLPSNQNGSNLIMGNSGNLVFPSFTNNIFPMSNPFLSTHMPYSGISSYILPNSLNALPIQNNNIQYSLIINPNIDWNCSTTSNVALQAVAPDNSLVLQNDVTDAANTSPEGESCCAPADQPYGDALDTNTSKKKTSLKKSAKTHKSSSRQNLFETTEVTPHKVLNKSPVSSMQQSNQDVIHQKTNLRRLLPLPALNGKLTPAVTSRTLLNSCDSYIQDFCNGLPKDITQTSELDTEIEIASTQISPLQSLLSSANLLATQEKLLLHSVATTSQDAATVAEGNETSQQVEEKSALNLESNETAYQALNEAISKKKFTKDTSSKSRQKNGKENNQNTKKIKNEDDCTQNSLTEDMPNKTILKKSSTQAKKKKEKQKNCETQSIHNSKLDIPVTTNKCSSPGNVVSTSMADEVLSAIQKALDNSVKEENKDFNLSTDSNTANLDKRENATLGDKQSVPKQYVCDTLKSICVSEEEFFENSHITSSNSGLGINVLLKTPELLDDKSPNNSLCKTSNLFKSGDSYKPKAVSPLKNSSSGDFHIKEKRKVKTISEGKNTKVLKRKANNSKKKSGVPKQPLDKKFKQNENSGNIHKSSSCIEDLAPSNMLAKLSFVKKTPRKSASPRYSLRTYLKKKHNLNSNVNLKQVEKPCDIVDSLKPRALELVEKNENKSETQENNSVETVNSFQKQSSISSDTFITPSFTNRSENTHSEFPLNTTEQTLFSQELFPDEQEETIIKETDIKDVPIPNSLIEETLQENKHLKVQLCSNNVMDSYLLLKKAVVLLKKLDSETLNKAMYPNLMSNIGTNSLPLGHNENSDIEMVSVCKENESQNASDQSKTLEASPRNETLISTILQNSSISKMELSTDTVVIPVENNTTDVEVQVENETKLVNSLEKTVKGNDILPSTLKVVPLENKIDTIDAKKSEETLGSLLEDCINTNPSSIINKTRIYNKHNDYITTIVSTTKKILPNQQSIQKDSYEKVSEIDVPKMKISATTSTVKNKEKTEKKFEKSVNDKQPDFTEESILSGKTEPSKSHVAAKKRKLCNNLSSPKQGINSKCDKNPLTTPESSLKKSKVTLPKSILKKTPEMSSITSFSDKLSLSPRELFGNKRPSLKMVGFESPPKIVPSVKVPHVKQKGRTTSSSLSHVAVQLDSSLLGPKLCRNINSDLKKTSYPIISKDTKKNRNEKIKRRSNDYSKRHVAENSSNSEVFEFLSQKELNQKKIGRNIQLLRDYTFPKEDVLETKKANSHKSNKIRNDFNLVKDKGSITKESHGTDIEKSNPLNKNQTKSIETETEKNLIKASVADNSKTKDNLEENPSSDDEVLILRTKKNKLIKLKSSSNPAVPIKDSSKPSISYNSDYNSPVVLDDNLYPNAPNSSSLGDKKIISLAEKSDSKPTSVQNESKSQEDFKKELIDLTLSDCNGEELVAALSAEMAKAIEGVNVEVVKKQMRLFGFENLMNLLREKE